MRLPIPRAARVLAGLTQAQLARRAGISLNTLVTYETGGRSTRPEVIAKVRSALESSGIVFRADGSIVHAEQIMDAFPLIQNPTAEQRAEYAIACSRCAMAGGRRPAMGEGARAIVDIYERSLGIGGHEE